MEKETSATIAGVVSGAAEITNFVIDRFFEDYHDYIKIFNQAVDMVLTLVNTVFTALDDPTKGVSYRNKLNIAAWTCESAIIDMATALLLIGTAKKATIKLDVEGNISLEGNMHNEGTIDHTKVKSPTVAVNGFLYGVKVISQCVPAATDAIVKITNTFAAADKKEDIAEKEDYL